MAGEWQRVRLGDHVSIRHGWPFKSECFSTERKGRPIVVSIGNFQYTGGFRFESTAVKEYTDAYPADYELQPRDVLLIMTCQTAGGEILGIPARVPDDGHVYLHNQRIGLAQRKSPAIDFDFLYWVFLSQQFNRHLVLTASGSKILHTAPSRIEAFEFELPSLPEQRAIAHILGTLDDKIELNRRTNETLEAMARALFKSWFVDFDPVRAKADGRAPVGMDAATAALFPSTLQDSETGRIPGGWKRAPLGEWVEVFSGGTPTKSDSAYWNGTIPWISPKVMTTIHADEADNFVTETAVGNGTRLAPAGATLVMVRGMGLHQEVRVSQAVTEVTFNQDVKALVGRDIEPTLLLFSLLDGQEALLSRVESSGHGTGRLPSDVLLSYPLTMPSKEVQAHMALPFTNINQRIVTMRHESRVLAEIRDTLLPRLLSGELSIPDAESNMSGGGL